MQDLATFRREQEAAIQRSTDLTIKLTECKTKLAALRQQRADAESSVRFATEGDTLKGAQDRLSAIVADITATEAERGRIAMLQPRAEEERHRTTIAVMQAEARMKALERTVQERRQELRRFLENPGIAASWPPASQERHQSEREHALAELERELTTLRGNS